jgi:hypothetical protein
MSAYPPPSENLPIFDSALFGNTQDLTINNLKSNFLTFPLAQSGLETIPNLAITSSGTAPTPASTSNDTTIATTAFVKSQTPSATSQKAIYYYNALPNTSGIPTPYPTITFANISSKNYWDGITFRIIITLQNNYSSTSATDPNGVLVYCGTFASITTIFPKAFITGNNICYLNNGIGGTTSNTAYSPITSSISSYVANGRPYWSSQITNDNNIVACFNPTLNNNGTISTMVFNCPAINWGGSTTMNYYMSFEVVNVGRYSASDITTSGFTTNF